MEKLFGKLLEYIQNNEELRNNTLVLFCSDNGPEKDAGQAGILKGYKTHLYEGGIRSSLVVWGPGFINKKVWGSRNTESVFAAIDIKPSLLEFAGVKEPNNSLTDGENLIKTILGKTTKSRQAPVFYSRPPDRKNFYGFNNLPDLAMRHGQWKLLCDYDGSRPELYNIVDDPGETQNLAAKNKEIVDDMTQQLIRWYKSMPVLEAK